MKNQVRLIVLFLCTSFYALHSQTIIHVPADEPTIQAALDNAEDETTILVSPGTYFEHLTWPASNTNIKLIGLEGSENTILDGGGTGRVLSMIREDRYSSNTIVAGFTIQNGYMLDDYYSSGIRYTGGLTTFRDLVVKDNVAEGEDVLGGGASISDFGGLMERCTFANNRANAESRSEGAGLFISVSNIAELSHCTFIGNVCTSDTWAFGGGLSIGGSGVNINNCIFENNATVSNNFSSGAGAFVDFWTTMVKIDSSTFINNIANAVSSSCGGGLHVSNGTDTQITNSSFRLNSSEDGAGIFIWGNENSVGKVYIGSTVVSNNTSLSNSIDNSDGVITGFHPINWTFDNCIIDQNYGKTIDIFRGDLNLNHCTIVYNSGHVEVGGSQMRASNSIFWNDSDREIIIDSEDDILLEKCVVRNGFTDQDIISEDPDLLSESLLVPSGNSPCLNAGIITDVSTDILGTSRPRPLNTNPDIGAYEIDENFNFVQVKFFHDENENGVKDDMEYYLSFGSVLQDEETSHKNMDEEGKFIAAQPGENSFSYDSSQNPNWELTNQSEYTFIIDDENSYEVIEYGISPIVNTTEVSSFITSGRFRCGEQVAFVLTLKNRGTNQVDGTAWLTIDERLENYSFSTEPDHITDNKVGWDFENLNPGDCLTFNFEVIAPFIEDLEDVGELYCFESDIESDDLLRAIPFDYKAELRCAYDPNDKLVNPYRDDNLALAGSDLLFTIRFQNTGNDYALNVVVIDTMDVNLDMNTFDIVSTSHSPSFDLSIDDRVVTFSFNRIFLPDSLHNEPASHGFINYTIRPKENVSLNSNIMNTAHIFFDFNPAIITNTTESIIVDEFPTVSTYELPKRFIRSYPNPASTQINLSEVVDQIMVYNTLGMLVLDVHNTNQVDVQKLEDGIYYVEFRIDDGIAIDKWIIKR